MSVSSRIEQALNDAIGRAEVPGCPPRLAATVNVFEARETAPRGRSVIAHCLLPLV